MGLCSFNICSNSILCPISQMKGSESGGWWVVTVNELSPHSKESSVEEVGSPLPHDVLETM